MKTRSIFITLFLFCFSLAANGQLMEKLKQRAKEKGIETSDEVKYDISAYDPNMDTHGDEGYEELDLNSAQEFYNRDVVMALYDYNGQLTQTSYFDADTIAMRTEMVGSSEPVYHDAEGKVYAFNDAERRFESIRLLPSASMGFLVAGMTTQLYKLPQQPYFDALKALDKVGSGLNFIVLEMAFVYRPEHFTDDYYLSTELTCNDSSHCVRFNYDDPEYPGSYIQFDEQGELVEFYINSTNGAFQDNPAGKFVFSYQECSVELPDAVEQSIVPGPLNKIINLERGLEPWKYNKKDK